MLQFSDYDNRRTWNGFGEKLYNILNGWNSEGKYLLLHEMNNRWEWGETIEKIIGPFWEWMRIAFAWHLLRKMCQICDLSKRWSMLNVWLIWLFILKVWEQVKIHQWWNFSECGTDLFGNIMSWSREKWIWRKNKEVKEIRVQVEWERMSFIRRKH